MKDLEIEYYLGILAILGIELYTNGNTTKIKNNVLKNNVLKGGKSLKGFAKSAGKGAGKGAVKGAKLAGKGAVKGAKLEGKGAVKGAKLAEKGAAGAVKLAGKGAAGAAKLAGIGILNSTKGTTANASAGSGFDMSSSGGMINNFFSPSWILIGCLIIGCVVFIIFMGAPSILIISLLVASWYFLRNQINRYFPPVDSNPVMKSNNQNQNNQNNNNF